MPPRHEPKRSASRHQLELRAKKIRERLAKAMPHPRCELDHGDAWQLLIATILSAQSTDKMVNEVTPDLFARWPKPSALAEASQEEVERVVRRTGFFRQKAKSIRNTSRSLVAEHGGEVPRDMDALMRLPGVARKTANLVMGSAFGEASGIIVDTHAKRVSARLGLTTHDDAVKVEADLCGLFPRASWVDMGHRLVLHGRYVCTARAPVCERCPLNEVCPAAAGEPAGSWSARAVWEGQRVESRGETS